MGRATGGRRWLLHYCTPGSVCQRKPAFAPPTVTGVAMLPVVSAGRCNASNHQSMWKTSRSDCDTGELSGFDGMISRMCAHHRWHTSVEATCLKRSSSSISR